MTIVRRKRTRSGQGSSGNVPNCIADGGGPSKIGLQGLILNNHKLL